MIVECTQEFVNSLTDIQKVELMSAIALNDHYIKLRHGLFEIFDIAINKDGGTKDKNIFKQYALELSKRQASSLYSKIELVDSADFSVYIALLNSKSHILVENEVHDGNTIKRIVDAYKNSKEYRYEILQLCKAFSSSKIVFENGGGTITPELIQSKESTVNAGVYSRLRIGVIVDSDTANASEVYTHYKYKNLLKHIYGLEFSEKIKIAYVHDRNNPTKYTFHMWHKRELENYFPNKAYIQHRMDVSKLSTNLNERDYQDIGSLVDNYTKTKLINLTLNMGRKDYEDMSKNYPYGNGKSEIFVVILKLLFLL